MKIHVLKNYSKRLGINILDVRGRKNLELALNNLLSKGLPSDVVEFKGTVVQDVEHCESGVHSKAFQSKNNPSKVLELSKYFGSSNHSVIETHGIKSNDGEAKELFSKDFTIDFATQLKHYLNKQLDHGLHVVGSITLPTGVEYDRIFNSGGGDCFFIAVSQGCKFFGMNISHTELRSRVGQWIQGNAYVLELQLAIQPIDLYDHLKRFPPPAQGWWSYLLGMNWVQWGEHVEIQGEWVGPLEVNPTNHVLEENGSDLRVNVYSPIHNYIVGNEANLNENGVEKPIIMLLCTGGHFEWLRMKTG